MNLESGFLILYDWLPALQTLSGEDYKALVEALIARQRSGKALPSFANPMVQVFADMMEPTIVRRLKGSECAKRQKGACGTPTSPLEATPEATPEGTLEATPQPRKEKQSKDKHSKAELSGAEHSGAEGVRVREGEGGTPSYAPREEIAALDPQVAPRQPPAPTLREEREKEVFGVQKTPPMHQGDTSEALMFGAITLRRTPKPAFAARIRSRSRTDFPFRREPWRQSPASFRHSGRSWAQRRSSA